MGVFVAFEGGDGVGKSTQIQLARDWVSSQGWQVVTTREPGGTALGDSLRELLLHAEEDVSPRAEALLFAADRAQHAAQVIIPAINAGKVVITDRFMASSVAYQGNGRALGATGGLVPNLTVLLDMDPALAASRQAADPQLGEPDRMEAAGLEFQARVRQEFLKMAQGNDSWLVVDATLSREEIARQVRLRLAQLLPVITAWGGGAGGPAAAGGLWARARV